MQHNFEINLNPPPICFFKFSEEMYINALYEKGEIYMSPITELKNHPDSNIGDLFEGASLIAQDPNGDITFTLNGKTFTYKDDNFRLTQFYDLTNLNSYSLYSLHAPVAEPGVDFYIDSRMKSESWTHALWITNAREFLILLFKALMAKKPSEIIYGHVRYKDFKKTGISKHNLFDKDILYSYQNEFKIISKHDITNPIKLHLGSLRHISKKITVDSALQKIELSIIQ